MHVHYGNIDLDSEESENSQVIFEDASQYVEDVDIIDEGFHPQTPSFSASLAVSSRGYL